MADHVARMMMWKLGWKRVLGQYPSAQRVGALRWTAAGSPALCGKTHEANAESKKAGRGGEAVGVHQASRCVVAWMGDEGGYWWDRVHVRMRRYDFSFRTISY